MNLENIAQMTKLEERAEKAEARIKELEELARKRSDTIVKLLQRSKEAEAELTAVDTLLLVGGKPPEGSTPSQRVFKTLQNLAALILSK